jgi:cyclopropane fatty-acyl-phospholipid synthase-like methyltransferase
MSVYGVLRGIWHSLPASLRASPGFRRLGQEVAGDFREHHQHVYTRAYYEDDVDGPALQASTSISRSVCRDLMPTRVVDVGSGSGALLTAFASRGVSTMGLEYSEAGRAISTSRNVETHAFDVRFDSPAGEWGKFDVACCTEVAEHIPAEFADRLVKVLVTLAKTVVFTAATPGQGGVDHVNEQPHSYWIEKFLSHGYSVDQTLRERWSAEWKDAGVAYWYWKNVIVFTKT